MKVLYNIYVVLFLFLLGPEAVAKSLPMKKVQTVETVWVPMTQEEVDDSTEAIEAVEIPENQQGAVPLFKEAQAPAAVQPVAPVPPPVTAPPAPQVVQVITPPMPVPPPPSREDPRPALAGQNLPGVQIKALEGEGGAEQRPIIQVIYQGVKETSQVATPQVPAPPPPPPVAEEPLPEPKPLMTPEKTKKTKGDVYNFYFSS